MDLTSSNIEFATCSINTILKFNGIDPKTVTLVPINSNMVPAFLENKVDAIFSAYRTYEVQEIRQQEPGVNIFYYEENGIPSYEQVILITNRESLNLPPELKKFIQALRESCSFIRNYPEEAWQSYVKHLPEKDTPLERDIFFQLSSMFVNDPSAFSIGKYEKFAEYLSKNNFLKEPLKVGFHTLLQTTPSSINCSIFRIVLENKLDGPYMRCTVFLTRKEILMKDTTFLAAFLRLNHLNASDKGTLIRAENHMG